VPSETVASYGSDVTVTVTLKDMAGAPLTGNNVIMETTASSLLVCDSTVTPTEVITNTHGVAVFNLKYQSCGGKHGQVHVSLTVVDHTDSTTLPDAAEVEFGS